MIYIFDSMYDSNDCKIHLDLLNNSYFYNGPLYCSAEMQVIDWWFMSNILTIIFYFNIRHVM